MEHIVQFAISLDDKTIQKRLEENAYQDVCQKLANEAASHFPTTYGNSVNWKYIMDHAMNDFLSKYKDEIIDAAAEKLKDSFCRTKVYKEKMKDAIDGSDN